MRALKPLAFSLLILGMSAASLPQPITAQIDRSVEFRLDSEVFVGDSKTPANANKTIFSEGLIFDFPVNADGSAPQEIAVYDSLHKTISFLNMQRQVQLKLHDLQVEKLLQAMREQMLQDPRSKALLEQTFDEQLDVKTNSATLIGSQKVQYRFFGQPPENTKILPAYFQFLDAFTRAQASNPQASPPFARMRLNQSLRITGWIPRRVEISFAAGSFFREAFKAHTTHKLTETLTQSDRREIELAKKSWAVLPEVNLNEYRNLDSQQSFLSRVTEKVADAAANK